MFELITGEEHQVELSGIKLYVWEKYYGSPQGKPIVVLAHGSATAGRESFDLQVPGKSSYSLMDFLAMDGFDVFAPDVRGFGRSTKPEGHMTTAEAGEDLNAVMDYILRLRSVKKVNLLCWSWGTLYGGMFLIANAQKISKFVSYAQMHANSPDIARRKPMVKAFRNTAYINIPEEGWISRFYSMTPSEVNDPEVVDAYGRASAVFFSARQSLQALCCHSRRRPHDAFAEGPWSVSK